VASFNQSTFNTTVNSILQPSAIVVDNVSGNTFVINTTAVKIDGTALVVLGAITTSIPILPSWRRETKTVST
jgi:hypothetical protein